MDPRHGRRAAARRARLIALVAANALALGLLVWVAASGGGTAAAPAEALPGGAEVAPSEPAEPEPLADPTRAFLAPPPWLDTPAPPSRSVEPADLEPRVRRIVAAAVARAVEVSEGRCAPRDVTVAVHVEPLAPCGEARPRPWVSLAPDASLAPASNLKLVTTAAALVLLGPEATFTTTFEAAGPISGGELRGDLVVRAGGDPLIGEPRPGGEGLEGDVAPLLEPLVAELVGRGVRRVTGDLVLDEGSFADPAPGPSWPDAGQHWTDYCALAGGFSANGGCLMAVVETGAGPAARVAVRPAAHGLAERLDVRVVERGALSVAVGARRTGVTVRGEIPRSVPRWSASFAHPEPVELFGAVLRAALARGGIRVDGALRRERGAPGGPVVARLRSPVARTLVPINTHSVNGVADQLFLATGLAVEGSGTRAASARATRRALERLGVSAEGLVQVDGSGLSRDNRVRAPQVAALLAAVACAGSDVAGAFRESLAVAGRSGTLDDRLRGTPAAGRVYAKTGWISGVSALSGFAQRVDGRELVFSILVEYPRLSGLNNTCWKPMQDEICELLVGGGR